VLAGDAGVGKSRLAREALSQVSGRHVVRWVTATTSARALPLGVFAEWIGDATLEPLLLVREIIDALTASPQGKPVVVGVDDGHLLDELSAFLVLQLAQRRLANVVVTVRNRETAPDAVTALWKDSYLERLELQPLSRPESDSLLTQTLGGPIDLGAAQQLWNLTRGNVLFLRHLVDQELAANRLHQNSGMWSWSGEPRAFTTLGELIDAQMGALSDPIREVLDLVAVGEPIRCDVLAAMVSEGAVDDAEARGLITIDNHPKPSARLAHPLYGDVRRARGGALRLRRLRGRLVSALADSAVLDRRDLIYRALLTLDSDLPPDATLFIQAAGAAMQLLDPVLAERLAGAAKRAGGGFEAISIQQFALHLVGRVTEAEHIMLDAADAEFTPDEQIKMAVFRAGNLFWGLGAADRAVSVIEAAQARPASASGGALQAFRALIEAANGQTSAAIGIANAVAASSDSDLAAMVSYYTLILALGYAGRADDVADVATHGYQLAARSLEASPLVFGFTEYHVQALILAGYQSEAEALTQGWARQTAEIPVAYGAYGAMLIGRTELSAGRVGSARDWLEKAMHGYTRHANTKYGTVTCRTDLVIALAASGNDVHAARELRTLEAERNPFGFMESRCTLAAAWVSAAQGAVTEAVAQCWRAAAVAQSRGHFGQEVNALYTATRFGDPTTADRLAELCAIVHGPRVTAASAYATALAAGDAAGLAAAAEQFERMGDMLAAADAAAHAARCHRRQGRRGAALTADEHVHRLAQRCDGADTPALRELTESAPLTARQREIFTLAAQGLSNRQIAERLQVSIRTVEGHRYRARDR